MQRITISMDDALSAGFDRLLRARGYTSRSEAVRDMVRETLEAWRGGQVAGAHCVANLSYVYNRHTRALARRLSELQHDNHDLVAATTQVHLDHDHTLESVMLKGPAAQVRAFADGIRAERGVRFGSLNLISVDPHEDHADPGRHTHAGHAHLSPLPG